MCSNVQCIRVTHAVQGKFHHCYVITVTGAVVSASAIGATQLALASFFFIRDKASNPWIQPVCNASNLYSSTRMSNVSSPPASTRRPKSARLASRISDHTLKKSHVSTQVSELKTETANYSVVEGPAAAHTTAVSVTGLQAHIGKFKSVSASSTCLCNFTYC